MEELFLSYLHLLPKIFLQLTTLSAVSFSFLSSFSFSGTSLNFDLMTFVSKLLKIREIWFFLNFKKVGHGSGD